MSGSQRFISSGHHKSTQALNARLTTLQLRTWKIYRCYFHLTLSLRNADLGGWIAPWLVLQGEEAELWAGRCLALARYSYKRIPALWVWALALLSLLPVWRSNHSFKEGLMGKIWYLDAAPALSCGTSGTTLMNSLDIALSLFSPGSPYPAASASLQQLQNVQGIQSETD